MSSPLTSEPLITRSVRVALRNRNKTLSRDDLLDSVWGYGEIPSTRTVDVHVAWLRQKLGQSRDEPGYIRTVRKHGYVFVAD